MTASGGVGLLTSAPQLEDLFADVLGGVLDVLHGLAGPGARGLVPALGLADVVLDLDHELLEAFVLVHAGSLCWGWGQLGGGHAVAASPPHNSTSTYLRVCGSSRSITSSAAWRYLVFPSRSMLAGAQAAVRTRRTFANWL